MPTNCENSPEYIFVDSQLINKPDNWRISYKSCLCLFCYFDSCGRPNLNVLIQSNNLLKVKTKGSEDTVPDKFHLTQLVIVTKL